MANNWQRNFLFQQVQQLWQSREDDNDWQTAFLPDWNVVELTLNEIMNELDTRYNNDWQSLDEIFIETESPYLSFAGNGEGSRGFIVFLTENYQSYYIIDDLKIWYSERELLSVQLGRIIQYRNDLHGQIALLVNDLDKQTFYLISNPFVSVDINEFDLLIFKLLVFEPSTFETIKWKDDTSTQANWDLFCTGINWKIAFDQSENEYAETFLVSNLVDNRDDYGGLCQQFIFLYTLGDESELKPPSDTMSYLLPTIPELDIQCYNGRIFNSVNVANEAVLSDVQTWDTSDMWVDFARVSVGSEPVDAIEIKGGMFSLTQIAEASDAPGSGWKDFKNLNAPSTTGQSGIRGYFGWLSAYYDWLKEFNGNQIYAVGHNLSFVINANLGIGQDNGGNLAIWINGERQEPFHVDRRTNDSYSEWYVFEATRNWIKDGILQVDADFTLPDGTPLGQQPTRQFIFYPVLDIDSTIVIQPSRDSSYTSDVMTFHIRDLAKIQIPDNFEQRIHYSGPDGRVMTSVFTFPMGNSDINLTKDNLIHEVDYSVQFMNLPSFTTDQELYLGYVNNQNKAQIDNVLWHYETDDDDNEKVVVDGEPVVIEPFMESAKSIFTHQVRNEVIFHLTDSNDTSYAGVIYTQNNTKVTNLVELTTNENLFLYYKYDNAIILKSWTSGKELNAQLSYTEQDENFIYFREPRNNPTQQFILKRIALLKNNFVLSDNNITALNYQVINAYTRIGQNVLNNFDINQTSIINNNNEPLVIADIHFNKNYYEEMLLGFNIYLSQRGGVPNWWRHIFEPQKMLITKMTLNDKPYELSSANFNQLENVLHIGFGIRNSQVEEWMYFGETGKIFKNKGDK